MRWNDENGKPHHCLRYKVTLASGKIREKRVPDAKSACKRQMPISSDSSLAPDDKSANFHFIMQNARRIAFYSGFSFAVLAAVGCASSSGGLKVIDSSDSKNPEFAKAKQVFATTESPLVRVRGYGGHKVTVHLKEASRGVIGTITGDIPKARVENTGRDIGFRSEAGWVVPEERENVRWVTTDLRLPLKPLPVGKYEVVLNADDGRTETQTFEVKANTH